MYGIHSLTVLDEANVLGILTEALTAQIQAILADETSAVGTDTAFTGTLAKVARMRIKDCFVGHGDT